MDRSDLGNRMKMYENQEAGRRFIPMLPVYARIDGRSFSKFTKGMERPYDVNFSTAMQLTTKDLVRETGACMGYTQSDEISLVWHTTNPNSSIFFDGRIQKMTSQLAALASVYFMQYAQQRWPEKITATKLPTFDARVFTLPNRTEAINCFVWREWDATKNSIFMAASHYYSHKQLHKKNGRDMFDMLLQRGVNWNEYPHFFKRGVYIARRYRDVLLSDHEYEKIPEKYRPKDKLVRRCVVEEIFMPPITSVINKEAVFFGGAAPLTQKV